MNYCSRLLLISALLALPALPSPPGFNLPLNNSLSLRNSDPFPLERAYHKMAMGLAPLSYLFPRSCAAEAPKACPESKRLIYRDDSSSQSFSVVPLAGYEIRNSGATVHEGDLGMQAFGISGAVSFYVDGRMFTELHENQDFISYDREPVDRQDEAASGSIAYASYSRYRSNLNYDWTWGRLVLAHDAVHWGPGQFGNLMFHQDAIPFDYLSFSTQLGPIAVHTLYGKLLPEGNRTFDTIPGSRSVYAHRYELAVTEDFLLGFSEQMILFNHEQPFAFVPLVPLFMTKGDGWERMNNGNLSVDASFRFPGIGTLYSEFLVDDLQAPTSLFDDQWGNKWAFLAGMHGIFNMGGFPAGLILEYNRLEPWVYTHYKAGTAQTANFGYPLGNQAGPNSQALSGKLYIRSDDAWYLSARADLSWKGNDIGSSLEDEHPENMPRKSFLAGADSHEIQVTPQASYTRSFFSVQGSCIFGKVTKGVLRLQMNYR